MKANEILNYNLKNERYGFNVCKTQNIFEMPKRKVEGKGPRVIYKTNILNVGFHNLHDQVSGFHFFVCSLKLLNEVIL